MFCSGIGVYEKKKIENNNPCDLSYITHPKMVPARSDTTVYAQWGILVLSLILLVWFNNLLALECASTDAACLGMHLHPSRCCGRWRTGRLVVIIIVPAIITAISVVAIICILVSALASYSLPWLPFIATCLCCRTSWSESLTQWQACVLSACQSFLRSSTFVRLAGFMKLTSSGQPTSLMWYFWMIDFS